MVSLWRLEPSRRNAAAAAATAAVVVGLVLYPTSTAGSGRRTAHAVSPAGTVSQQSGTAGGESGSHAGMDMGGGALPDGFLQVNGPAVDTSYGPVQVRVDLLDGQIVNATAILYPTETLADKAVNNTAIPALEAATLTAQSAEIDTISGATATSQGYRSSLQAALDAAHR